MDEFSSRGRTRPRHEGWSPCKKAKGTVWLALYVWSIPATGRNGGVFTRCQISALVRLRMSLIVVRSTQTST